MNARIKELYLQAHMVREYPEDDPMYGGNPPTVYWGGDKSAEKFAGLIIQKCMHLVHDINQEYDGGFTVVNAAEEIGEYFGVK